MPILLFPRVVVILLVIKLLFSNDHNIPLPFFYLERDKMAEALPAAKTPATIKEGWLLKRG